MTGALSDGPRSGRRDVLSDDPPQSVAHLAPRGRLSPLVKAVRAAKKIRRDHHRAEHWAGRARYRAGDGRRDQSGKTPQSNVRDRGSFCDELAPSTVGGPAMPSVLSA
jgi:hypothetical protein